MVQGREPAVTGEDSAQLDADHYDPERVRHLQEHRPLVHDQPLVGQPGVSSVKPGVDGGGYPEEPPARDDTEAVGEIDPDGQLATTSDQLDEHAKKKDASAEEYDQQPGSDEILPGAPDGGRPAAT